MLAILSLIFGIISLPTFCFWCLAVPAGVLALIFGAFGLGGKYRGLAISGMVCGGLGILISIIVVVLFVSSGLGSASSGGNPWR
ncbi:MAG: hypothetical protein ACHQ50_11920 [Fimbriimonadales bacterium]